MEPHITAQLEAAKGVETRWRLMIIHLQVRATRASDFARFCNQEARKTQTL